ARASPLSPVLEPGGIKRFDLDGAVVGPHVSSGRWGGRDEVERQLRLPDLAKKLVCMVDMPCRSFRADYKDQNRQRDRPTRRCTNRCEPFPDLLEHRVELQRPGRVRKPHLGSRSKDGPRGSLDQLTRARL